MNIGSYSKIYALGHRATKNIFDSAVTVEEKTDGSQYSWMVHNGELLARSRGGPIIVEHSHKLFTLAVETCMSLKDKLIEGHVYRGEAITREKHNVLKYNRIPTGGIVLFDVEKGNGTKDYMSYEEKKEEAARLGLEIVPAFFIGRCSKDDILKFLENESFLGGSKIEGVVIKNYEMFNTDGTTLMGKYVSERFKEVHRTEWSEANPQKKDILEKIINSIKTEARWDKAIQHLREEGKLLDEPKDIGPLIKEIQADVKLETKDHIKNALFAWAWPQVERRVIRGFPEYYKRKLLENLDK